jgi:hypothetical protein
VTVTHAGIVTVSRFKFRIEQALGEVEQSLQRLQGLVERVAWTREIAGRNPRLANVAHSRTSYSNATPSGSFSSNHFSAASWFANTLMCSLSPTCLAVLT